MVRLQRLMLLALPVSLLNAAGALGDTPSPTPGITREDQREERFYNFDNGRQSGGGFADPAELIRTFQGARNLQYATDPTDTLDTALEDFVWPDESSPEQEQTPDSLANQGSGSVQIPDDLFPQMTPAQGDTVESQDEEEGSASTPPLTTP